MGAQNGMMRPEPNREITNPTAAWLPSDALGDTLWAPAALVSLIPPALCPVEPVVSPLGQFSSGYLYSLYFQHFQCSQVSSTSEALTFRASHNGRFHGPNQTLLHMVGLGGSLEPWCKPS